MERALFFQKKYLKDNRITPHSGTSEIPDAWTSHLARREMSSSSLLATISTIQQRLAELSVAEPWDPTAVARVQLQLAVARESLAIARDEETHASRQELLDLQKSHVSMLRAEPIFSPPPRSTIPSRIRTPPPVASMSQGLDDSAPVSRVGAGGGAAMETEPIEPLPSRLLASIRADLLSQQHRPGAAETPEPGGAFVSVDVACRVVQGVLTTVDGRLVRYQALEQQLRAASGDAALPVELNVGGTRFHTTVGTLSKEPSFLQGMFSGYVVQEGLQYSQSYFNFVFMQFLYSAAQRRRQLFHRPIKQMVWTNP
jgi:hypothetical protein